MQRIARTLVCFLAIGWWAADRMPRPAYAADDQHIASTWRRTRDGWQRASWLPEAAAAQQPALHPAVFGALELMLAMAALLAFAADAPAGRAKR